MPFDFESEVLYVKQETQDVKSILFSVPREFKYAPANHIALEITWNGRKQMKAFSIASSPTETEKNGFIEIGKKITDSEFSQAFDRLKKGNKVRILGPYGRFLLDESRDALMLSGGIGITPLRNMMKYATDKKLEIKITLFYSNKTPEDIAFKEYLEELAKKNKNIKIVHTITRPEESTKEWNGRVGRIDEELIREELQELGDPIFYICGPPSMVNELAILLETIGISKDRIKLERFAGYE